MNKVTAHADPPPRIELCTQCRINVLWYPDQTDMPRYARVGPKDTRRQYCYKDGDHYQDPGIVYVRRDLIQEIVARVGVGETVEDAITIATTPRNIP